jgi:hypothetical protein
MAKKIKITLTQLQATFLVKILENYADCTEKAAIALGQVMNFEQDLKVSICAEVYTQICSQDKKLDPKAIQSEYKEYAQVYNEAMEQQAKQN